MEKEKDFNFANLPSECQDPSISKDDFKLVQVDAQIHDQKFETKPTTFLKDCLRRFAKNKSSVVAAVILGVLLLMSIVVPVAFKTSTVHDTENSHPELYYLEPKLFKSGTGFWDGTRVMKDIPVNTNGPRSEWGPDYERFNKNAVLDLQIGEEEYTTTANKYAKDGFVQFGYFANIDKDVEYVSYATQRGLESCDLEAGKLEVTTLDIYDEERLAASNEKTKTFPEGYVDAESALYFTFEHEEGGTERFEIALTEYQKSHNISSPIDVITPFKEWKSEKGYTSYKVYEPSFEIRVKNAKNNHHSCVLIRAVEIDASLAGDKADDFFKAFSFTSGNAAAIRTPDNDGYWSNISKISYSKATSYLIRAVLCTFRYDTYEAALGKDTVKMNKTALRELRNKGYLNWYIPEGDEADYDPVTDTYSADTIKFRCSIPEEYKDECPLIHPFTPADVEYDDHGMLVSVRCDVLKYKMAPYNLSKMPKFLLGTDIGGRDMFIYVFEGLRTSLILGVLAAAVCFIFGLIWGAIAGYFGGTVDLVMERFTDILSGVPWIVVMTLTIIKLGDAQKHPFFATMKSGQLILFMIALCLTGWIGTAATTRTQFYRFRGREYVLASRTLGASHARLISKHILPNAMGTIITSAVLMVPSIIFSEATIAYLGLGLQGMRSLGIILSDNQVELTNHPYLLIFPAVIIALLMISFNLFGNGLRDAVNPSLKGEGE